MQNSRLLGIPCAILFNVITLPSYAALIPVLGGQAIYDDQLKITWTADANLNGTMDWATADNWAANLTIDGVSGWRLPSMDVNNDGIIVNCSPSSVSPPEAVCRDNQYAHLYYYGAGTTSGSGVTSASPGPFSNVQAESYWSSTEQPGASSPSAWRFNFNSDTSAGGGAQNTSFKTISHYALAVHSGNAGAVPVPATIWLFGSGLLGLIGVARQRS